VTDRACQPAGHVTWWHRRREASGLEWRGQRGLRLLWGHLSGGRGYREHPWSIRRATRSMWSVRRKSRAHDPASAPFHLSRFSTGCTPWTSSPGMKNLMPRWRLQRPS